MSRATDIRDAARDVLLAASTAAGANVLRAAPDSVAPENTPAIRLHINESKTGVSAAGSAPIFDCSATLYVQCLVAHAELDPTVVGLDALLDAALLALLQNADWVSLSGQVESITISRLIRPDGEFLVGDGLLQIVLSNWRETYAPVLPDTLATITLQGDAGQPFDANGTYPPLAAPPFTAPPPPRQSGPDGRIEIAGTITLPQN